MVKGTSHTHQNAQNKPTRGKDRTFSFYVTYYTIEVIKPHFGRAVEKPVHLNFGDSPRD